MSKLTDEQILGWQSDVGTSSEESDDDAAAFTRIRKELCEVRGKTGEVREKTTFVKGLPGGVSLSTALGMSVSKSFEGFFDLRSMLVDNVNVKINQKGTSGPGGKPIVGLQWPQSEGRMKNPKKKIRLLRAALGVEKKK